MRLEPRIPWLRVKHLTTEPRGTLFYKQTSFFLFCFNDCLAIYQSWGNGLYPRGPLFQLHWMEWAFCGRVLGQDTLVPQPSTGNSRHIWIYELLPWYEITHYQTTNFRIFQTERVCRRHFQIWKWLQVIQTVREYCGKRRNCSLRAISPFPTVFSKGLFPRGVKRCHCVGMG